jgi:hypothetical protein
MSRVDGRSRTVFGLGHDVNRAAGHRSVPDYDDWMCRNITELRGLQPPATDDEVEAAARQFIRKVSGLQKPPAGAEEAYERAIANVTAEVHALLDELPARRQPPATVPPLRRPEVRARIAAREKARA